MEGQTEHPVPTMKLILSFFDPSVILEQKALIHTQDFLSSEADEREIGRAIDQDALGCTAKAIALLPVDHHS
jgi:hypothetical protein